MASWYRNDWERSVFCLLFVCFFFPPFLNGCDYNGYLKIVSGWTPYVYYTTLYSIPRYTINYIYANLLGTFFEKSGEIKLRDGRARKRVEYRV